MANIRRLKEDELVGKIGSKETVLPVTVGKAVFVDKKPLPKVLDTKWNIVSTYTVTEYKEDTSETNYVYYLVAFNNELNREIFNAKVFGSQVTKDIFASYINEVGKEKEKQVIEEEDVYPTSNYYWGDADDSESALLGRIEFPTVKNLYLQCVKLHSASTPKFSVVDEDGNEYAPGDTVTFNDYPGVLYILVEGIDKYSYISQLTDLILDRNKINPVYGLVSSSKKDSMNDEMGFNWGRTSATKDFTNPAHRSNGESLNILNISLALDDIFSGSIKLYILPTDYPSSSLEFNEYRTKVKKGNITIKEECYYQDSKNNKVDYLIYGGVKPSNFNVVFNPNRNFYLEDVPESIILDKNNKYRKLLSILGKNATADKVLEIKFKDTDKYAIGSRSTVETKDSVILNYTDVLEGTQLYIQPKNWKSTSDYVPTSDSSELIINYGSINEQSVFTPDTTYFKEIRIPIETRVTQTSINSSKKTVNTVLRDYNNSSRLFYVDLHFGKNIENINIKSIKGSYYQITSDSWDTTPTEFTEGIITQYSTSLENEAFVDYKALENLTIPTEDLASQDMSLLINVPYNNDEGYKIRGDGSILVNMEWEGIPINIEIPFSYSSEIMQSDVREEFLNWKESFNVNTKLIADSTGHMASMNRLFPNEVRTVATSGDLSDITDIKEFHFANTDMEDASFMRYLTSISEIPDWAFYENQELTTIDIPENVTRIGKEAFLHCPNLSTVNFLSDDNLIEIDNNAFVGTAITSIKLPNSVTTLGKYVFAECPNLTTVEFGNGVTIIKDTIFSDSPSITDVYFKNRVEVDTMIGGNQQIFTPGSTITIHVPSELLSEYQNSHWATLPNVTINFEAITD